MNRFKQKTVLVTGGSSGIGLATAKAFAAEGARVVITGRDRAALNEAEAAIGNDVIAIQVDAAQLVDTLALAEALRAHDLHLDAVFLNARIAKFAPLTDVDSPLWDQTFEM